MLAFVQTEKQSQIKKMIEGKPACISATLRYFMFQLVYVHLLLGKKD
jgi:hypothetical protein